MDTEDIVSIEDFGGSTAVVTGGGSGIGRAVVEVLAARGARVVALDRDAAALASLTGAGVETRRIDVTDAAAVDATIEDVVARHGRLDVVVTAAGVQRYGSVAATTPELWAEVLDVNVTGCFHVVRAALPHLRRTQGSVVLVSSVQTFAAQNDAAAYVTSKAALGGLVRSLAVDEAPHGVRANMVCPGSVDTPMLRASARLFSDGTPEGETAVLESWGSVHPIGRIARTEEVAEVVAFLASTRASFVTGVALPVDGGLVARLAVTVEN